MANTINKHYVTDNASERTLALNTHTHHSAGATPTTSATSTTNYRTINATRDNNAELLPKTVTINDNTLSLATIAGDALTSATLNYIYTNNVHIAIARKTIKRIASLTRVTRDGRTIPAFRQYASCMDIINSGYTQAITQDIEQAIALELLTLVNDAHLSLAYDIDTHAQVLAFAVRGKKRRASADDNDKPQEIVSYYLNMYTCVQATLADYKTKQANDGVITNIDAIASDNAINATFTRTIDGEKRTYINSAYMHYAIYDGGLNDVIKRHDVDKFWEYVASATSNKKYTTLYNVFCGTLAGYKQEKIADIYNYSVITVKKARADLRTLYSNWKRAGNSIELSSDGSNNLMYGTTTATTYHNSGKANIDYIASRDNSHFTTNKPIDNVKQYMSRRDTLAGATLAHSLANSRIEYTSADIKQAKADKLAYYTNKRATIALTSDNTSNTSVNTDNNDYSMYNKYSDILIKYFKQLEATTANK